MVPPPALAVNLSYAFHKAILPCLVDRSFHAPHRYLVSIKRAARADGTIPRNFHSLKRLLATEVSGWLLVCHRVVIEPFGGGVRVFLDRKEIHEWRPIVKELR